ncbi:hypothetical protein O181_008017 [Austropuccinia psidii MF-1]|uniref:Tf2-1-like SH3-like domain-containing protein n=1 Tax=Austropuccinia psidii MF-1 TaxID=1389203 RepID=A0A9Q3BNX7_9BASI|nr:hypothetical protein [Austropuccinia psidii MF-1]
MEPEFKEGDEVSVSTLKFNNLKGPKKVTESFVGPFTIIKLIGKNEVEVRLTEEFSRKHPVFPVSLVKPYLQTGEDKFPSRNKTNTPKDIVEVEDYPGPVENTRMSSKYKRKYLVRFKSQTADKDKWLAEDNIPDGNLQLKRLRASRRAEQSHQ